jgi:hypothetical protein
VENASDARLLYMCWACQLAVVFNSEPVVLPKLSVGSLHVVVDKVLL